MLRVDWRRPGRWQVMHDGQVIADVETLEIETPCRLNGPQGSLETEGEIEIVGDKGIVRCTSTKTG